jgi:hypothetical protein
MSEKITKDGERLGAELYGLWASPQARVGPIEAKVIENDAPFISHLVPNVTEILPGGYDSSGQTHYR